MPGPDIFHSIFVRKSVWLPGYSQFCCNRLRKSRNLVFRLSPGCIFLFRVQELPKDHRWFLATCLKIYFNIFFCNFIQPFYLFVLNEPFFGAGSRFRKFCKDRHALDSFAFFARYIAHRNDFVTMFGICIDRLKTG